MDAVNRRVSVGLLTEFAGQTDHTQHIFISPNSQQFANNKEVRSQIHRLTDANRGNRGLDGYVQRGNGGGEDSGEDD